MSYYSGRAKIRVDSKEVTLTLEAIDEGLASLLHESGTFVIKDAPSFHSVGTATVKLVSDKSIELVPRNKAMTMILGNTALRNQPVTLTNVSYPPDIQWQSSIVEIGLTLTEGEVVTNTKLPSDLWTPRVLPTGDGYAINQLNIHEDVFDTPGLYQFTVIATGYQFTLPSIIII